MFKPIFTTIFKRRDVYIYLAFASLPLLMALASAAGVSLQMDQSVMQSFLAYWLGMLDLQTNIVLPILIFSFVIASAFREDIDTGRLFLYKDLPKGRIFRAKIMSLYATYGLSLIITLVTSALSYVIFLGGGALLTTGLDLLEKFLQLLTTVGLHLTTITAIAYVSIKKKTLVAVLTGLFIYLFQITMPVWFGLQLLAPGYYVQKLTAGNAVLTTGIVLGLIVLYVLPLYVLAAKSFRKIQF